MMMSESLYALAVYVQKAVQYTLVTAEIISSVTCHLARGASWMVEGS